MASKMKLFSTVRENERELKTNHANDQKGLTKPKGMVSQNAFMFCFVRECHNRSSLSL